MTVSVWFGCTQVRVPARVLVTMACNTLAVTTEGLHLLKEIHSLVLNEPGTLHVLSSVAGTIRIALKMILPLPISKRTPQGA